MRIFANCIVTPLLRRKITFEGLRASGGGGAVEDDCFVGHPQHPILQVTVDVPDSLGVIYGRGSVGVPGVAYLPNEAHRRLPRESLDEYLERTGFGPIISAEVQRHPDLHKEINGEFHHAQLLASQIASDIVTWFRPGWDADDYTALRSATFDAVMAMRS